MIIKNIAAPGFEEIWHGADPDADFNGFIAIHSTARGPAIGGVRFRSYASEQEALHEVKRLAEAMTYKAAAANLSCGGGKGVIMKPVSEFDRTLHYQRFAEMIDHLEGRYISATDAGTTLEDVAEMKRRTRWVGGAPTSEGGAGAASPITALGVLSGIKASWQQRSGTTDLKGVRVVIQGLGAVGAELTHLLKQEQCEIWGGDIDPKVLMALAQQEGIHSLIPELLLSQEADIFVPCALGEILNPTSIPELKVQVVAGSANNQLEEPARDAAALKARGILYAPDFLINAGGLIHIVEEFRGYDANRVRSQVEQIGNHLREIYARARNQDITTHQAALDLAQERLK